MLSTAEILRNCAAEYRRIVALHDRRHCTGPLDARGLPAPVNRQEERRSRLNAGHVLDRMTSTCRNQAITRQQLIAAIESYVSPEEAAQRGKPFSFQPIQVLPGRHLA